MAAVYRPPAPTYRPVYEPGSGKLLFKFDSARGLIEIQRRGIVTVVDLAQEATKSAKSAEVKA